MEKITLNSNINHLKSLSFTSDNSILSDEEQIIDYTHKCLKYLSEKGEREVAQNGIFSKVYAGYNIPNSNNQIIIYIEHDENNPKDLRRLVVACRHKNSDRLFYQCLSRGTKKDILDYIKNPDNFNSFLEFSKHLNKVTDEYYAGL